MSIRLRLILILALLLVMVTAPLAAQESSRPRLHVHRNSAAAGSNAIPADLRTAAPGPYAIVQFDGPVSVADRAALEATGVAILEYLPDYAYLVRGSNAELARAVALPQVRRRASFTLADKLSPALLRAMGRGEPLGRVRLAAWPGREAEMARALRARGISPDAITADGTRVRELATIEAVRWIEPDTQPRLLNDYARAVMEVDGAWARSGYYGAGQTVAVADTGLDTGDPATLSPDFAGRVVAAHTLVDGEQWDDDHGHGTHVAGSIAGSGVQSGADPATRSFDGSYAGIAPEAGLVIQGFEADPTTGQIFGLEPDYYPLFEQAYADGARLLNASWGDVTGPSTDPEASYGGYPFGAQRTDQFVWDHPDMAIFAAAGNAARDGTPNPDAFGFCTGSDGIVDPDSLLSPATAKNVITVGASESNRNSGGMSGFPWLLINLCFGAEPIATDTVSDNAQGMAAISSRGPTDDGRAKPDLVAPGTNILSNASHVSGATNPWPHEVNVHYNYRSGTSMATPMVTGLGALTRQWLQEEGNPAPSAAAIKAALLNGTADIAPGQYGTGTYQEVPFTRPDNVAGWGRASAAFLNPAAPYGAWVDDHTVGLATGDDVLYSDPGSLRVFTDTMPLRVMLVWTDPPASLSAAQQLVNDLDLEVTAPDGTVYYGNGVQGDRLNNVEGVIIPAPALGTYEVRVHAHNVPVDNQPYALAVAGPVASEPVVVTATQVNGDDLNLDWTETTNATEYVVYGSSDPYFSPSSENEIATVTPPDNSYLHPDVLATSEPVYYQVVAYDEGGEIASSGTVGAFPFALIQGTP